MTSSSSPGLDRRGALRLLGGAAASTVALTAATARPAAAEPVLTPRPPVVPVLTRALPPGPEFDRHLLRRTTYGASPALLADVQAAGGTAAWLETQLAPERIDDSACDRVVARFPLAQLSPPEVQARVPAYQWNAMYDLVRMTAARQLWSRRQLLEVMVELWSDHLNVPCPQGKVWSSRMAYDVLVRRHALGTFSDLLVGSMQSPAMLHYLDGATSRRTAPNENYGRELLELHTVGLEGGQTQDDVVDAARAFTGLTVWRGADVPADRLGTLRYDPKWRWTGPLRVLGWTHPNADPAAGLEVATSLVRYLATHPSTARRIARRLVVRFVSDDAPAALVDRLAQVYLDSGTAIVPVLRALFASSEFAASAGLKFRRPWEDVVATARALGVQPSADGRTGDIASLVWQGDQVGHAPMAWPAPNGYPDVAPAWIGTGSLLGRWNVHTSLARGAYTKGGFVFPGTLYARLLPGAAPADRAQLVRAVWERLLPGAPLLPAHLDALVLLLGGPGPLRAADTTTAFPLLVSVVLSSPHWSAR